MISRRTSQHLSVGRPEKAGMINIQRMTRLLKIPLANAKGYTSSHGLHPLPLSTSPTLR